jgi:hypothetical protein
LPSPPSGLFRLEPLLAQEASYFAASAKIRSLACTSIAGEYQAKLFVFSHTLDARPYASINLDAVAAETTLIRPDEPAGLQQSRNLIRGFRIVGRKRLRVDVDELFGADKLPRAIPLSALIG